MPCHQKVFRTSRQFGFHLSEATIAPLVGLAFITSGQPTEAQSKTPSTLGTKIAPVAGPSAQKARDSEKEVSRSVTPDRVGPTESLVKKEEATTPAESQSSPSASKNKNIPTRVRDYFVKLWDSSTVDLVGFLGTAAALLFSFGLGRRAWKRGEFRDSCTAYLYFRDAEGLSVHAFRNGTINSFWQESNHAGDVIHRAEKTARRGFPFLAFRSGDIFKSLRNEISESFATDTMRCSANIDGVTPLRRQLFISVTYEDLGKTRHERGRTKLRVVSLWREQVQDILDSTEAWIDSVRDRETEKQELVMTLIRFATLIANSDPRHDSYERLRANGQAHDLRKLFLINSPEEAWKWLDHYVTSKRDGCSTSSTPVTFSEQEEGLIRGLLLDKTGTPRSLFKVVDNLFAGPLS